MNDQNFRLKEIKISRTLESGSEWPWRMPLLKALCISASFTRLSAVVRSTVHESGISAVMVSINSASPRVFCTANHCPATLHAIWRLQHRSSTQLQQLWFNTFNKIGYVMKLGHDAHQNVRELFVLGERWLNMQIGQCFSDQKNSIELSTGFAGRAGRCSWATVFCFCTVRG